MQLKIENISWPNRELEPTLVSKIGQEIGKKLRQSYNVDSVIKVTEEGILFAPADSKGDKQYLFASIVENKIPLDPKGAMAKKLGRNYMVSHRLTRKQWEAVNSTVLSLFDNLKLNCKITYDDGVSPLVLKDVGVSVPWPSPTKFTEEKS